MSVTLEQMIGSFNSGKKWYGFALKEKEQVDKLEAQFRNAFGNVEISISQPHTSSKIQLDILLSEEEHDKALRIFDNLFCTKA